MIAFLWNELTVFIPTSGDSGFIPILCAIKHTEEPGTQSHDSRWQFAFEFRAENIECQSVVGSHLPLFDCLDQNRFLSAISSMRYRYGVLIATQSKALKLRQRHKSNRLLFYYLCFYPRPDICIYYWRPFSIVWPLNYPRWWKGVVSGCRIEKQHPSTVWRNGQCVTVRLRRHFHLFSVRLSEWDGGGGGYWYLSGAHRHKSVVKIAFYCWIIFFY